jgi:DNA-binding CsgD family transcriptional regulator
MYFQVFIFTFGFYGIWGQVIIKAFFSPYLSPDLLIRFIDIASLLGLPFLIFAWLMLLRFAGEISGRQFKNWHVACFLLVNFLIIFTVGYILTKANSIKPLALIKYYFIIMNLLFSNIAAFLIMFPGKGKNVFHNYDRKNLVPGIIFITILQSTMLLLYSNQAVIGLLFILAFFMGNTFPPVYLTYGTLLSSFGVEPEKDISFEEFCKKFEVSPRESDIVREICNGLSNKEISDKLFISLQTVKDHTHRIYVKTNIKSRVQLITLVKEELTPR